MQKHVTSIFVLQYSIIDHRVKRICIESDFKCYAAPWDYANARSFDPCRT